MSEPEFDVFLSHNGQDKAIVEQIAMRLEARGIRPWLDKWNLVPGEHWQEGIENALDNCSTCAVLLGRSGPSPWQNEEMRHAISRRVEEVGRHFRLIPVLLPGAKRVDQKLPKLMNGLTWVQFEKDIDEDEPLERFICGIMGQTDRPGVRAASAGASPADVVPNLLPKELPASRKHSDHVEMNERSEWKLTLEIDFDTLDPEAIRAIVSELKSITGDVHLRLTKIERGSVNLTIETTRAGIDRLQEAIRCGYLATIIGIIQVRDLEHPETPVYEPANEEIAELARSYWEARGCVGGSPEEDWLRAEQELQRESAAKFLRSISKLG